MRLLRFRLDIDLLNHSLLIISTGGDRIYLVRGGSRDHETSAPEVLDVGRQQCCMGAARLCCWFIFQISREGSAVLTHANY